MPTLTFSHKDINELVGKKLSIQDIENYAGYGKGELKSYNVDEITINFDDTNLPYLWSSEGFARLIKGIISKEKGIPQLKLNKSDHEIIVDPSVNNIRPFIGAFSAKGRKIDEHLLIQLIQLQEKVCETYGKRREKIAVGIYSLKKIKFPVYYKATDPESIKFIPLEFKKEMTQQEILEEHPKGREYKHLLKDFKKYPILIDSNKEVLSFPPIINSNFTGKVEENDSELFIEATGLDQESLNLALNIFAQALYDRGFNIYSCTTNYKDKKITIPDLNKKTINLNPKNIEKLLGLKLKDNEVKNLLEKAQFEYSNNKVTIPPYRGDIMHEVDIIEDIGIMYGYNKINPLELTSYTTGGTTPKVNFINKIRDLIIGFGFQEILSQLLTNNENLYKKMNLKDFGTIEIEDYVSESYSSVRSWLLPSLLEFLSKNQHVEFPHNIFEEGLVTIKKDNEIKDIHRLALVSSHEKANFTDMKSILESLISSLGLKYEIEETTHSSFIEGRVARILIYGKKLAYIGEIHPQVLVNWGLEMPVTALEINLDILFEAAQKTITKDF